MVITSHRTHRSRIVLGVTIRLAIAATLAAGVMLDFRPIGAATTTPGLTAFDLPKGITPGAITAGPDGNIWFLENSSDGDNISKVGRISPDGIVTQFDTPTPNSGPVTITAGPDGNVWFLEKSANNVAKITPAGVITEYPVPTPQSGLGMIIDGPDGNLWFTEFAGGNVGRITPAGAITEYAVPGEPASLVAGPQNSLWFALNNRPENMEQQVHSLGRITMDGTVSTQALSRQGHDADHAPHCGREFLVRLELCRFMRPASDGPMLGIV